MANVCKGSRWRDLLVWRFVCRESSMLELHGNVAVINLSQYEAMGTLIPFQWSSTVRQVPADSSKGLMLDYGSPQSLPVKRVSRSSIFSVAIQPYSNSVFTCRPVE